MCAYFQCDGLPIAGQGFFVRECGVGESLHVCVSFNLPLVQYLEEIRSMVCAIYMC